MILRGNVFSQVLEMDTGLCVFIPNRFEGRDRPYKLVYLLHGLCSNRDSILDYTMLPVMADSYPAVYVMPEVARSLYADMAHGQRTFTYITEELPRICESVFHISAAREDTSVVGISMGGYGALRCALTYPERYGACCAISPGPLYLEGFLPELREKGHTDDFKALYGEQFIRDYRAAFGEHFTWTPDIEPMALARRITAPEAAPRLYQTCGTEDWLLDLNRTFAVEMQALFPGYTYEECPGAHDWAFFNGGLERALAFI